MAGRPRKPSDFREEQQHPPRTTVFGGDQQLRRWRITISGDRREIEAQTIFLDPSHAGEFIVLPSFFFPFCRKISNFHLRVIAVCLWKEIKVAYVRLQ